MDAGALSRVAAVVATATLALLPGPQVAAHERASAGPATLEIGWLEEPAYAGLPNAVQVSISRGNSPVPKADLSVVVAFGDEASTARTEAMALEPVFGEPGEFRAFLIPTRSGTYTFEITGRVVGRKVDETVTSGPKTFDDVGTQADAQFPEQDPTQGELALRLERIDSRLAALRRDVATLSADDGVPPVLVWAALGLAALALVVALLRPRFRSAP